MIELLDDDKTIKEYLPIMGQKGYISAKSSNYGWFRDKDFAIAFVIDKRAIFKRLIFMCEVVSLDKSQVSKDDEKRFLEDIIDFIKQKKLVDFIYKAHSNVIFKSCPNKAICVPWGTFVVKLNYTDNELIKEFKPRERGKIRKAIREGVEIKESNNIELVYNIIKDTMQRQNSIHYPSIEYLKSLVKNIPNSVKFFLSYYQNRVQGCAVVVFDKNRAYIPYAGSIAKPEHIGALHLMHFEAMRAMYNLGVREYDFVGTRLYELPGSKFSGINRFKRAFNPRVDRGYSFKYIIDPIKYKLFNLTSKTYLSLKGFNYIDPIDQIKSEMQSKEVILWQE